MLRVGRFRHRLLDDDFLNHQTPLASSCLSEFLTLWRQQKLSDIEIAAIYIFIFSFLRRPKDFLGGPHNKEILPFPEGPYISAKEVHAILSEKLPAHLNQAKSFLRLKTCDEPFLKYFCEQNWRSIPFSVAKSLRAWAAGRYPLFLLTSVPSPHEVLLMQAQGARCLTMLIEDHELGSFVEEGRDVLGFIVHDLIHADHFFAHTEKAQAQVFFCKKLIHIHELPEIQLMMKQDESFKNEFHYLMSDMNSVPLHLLKTLKAVLLGHFKRSSGGMSAPLTLLQEQNFNQIFEKCLAFWDLPAEAHLAAQRLNTTSSLGFSDNELLHLALTRNFHDESEVLC